MSLLASLLSISIVLSVIMLSLMFFFRKAPYLLSAKSRYTLWIIILIGLLIPFRPSLVTPLLMVHQEEVTYPTEAQVLSDTEAVGEAQGDIIESATNAISSKRIFLTIDRNTCLDCVGFRCKYNTIKEYCSVQTIL